MKIYFALVTFNKIPLVWEYNKPTNRAICLFNTIEERTLLDKNTVLKELSESDYRGITISNDMATIEDVATFINLYPLKGCSTHVHIPCLKLDKIMEERTNTYSTFFPLAAESNREQYHQKSKNLGRIHSSYKISHITPSQSLASSFSAQSEYEAYSPHLLFEPKISAFKSIALDHLIICENDPGLWGDTVVYKSYFTEKTNKDRPIYHEIYLKNKESFYKENLYLFNDKIVPLKSNIIILIEKLLKEELNPIYQRWKRKQNKDAQSLEEFFKYFRGAVLRTMKNINFNIEQTEYEMLAKEERCDKFQKNQALYQIANLEIRKVRARLMMMDWLAIVDKSYPLESGSIQSLSPDAVNLLASFKKYLLAHCKQPRSIFLLIEALQAELIKAGEIERDNKLLTNSLYAKFTNKNAHINNYTSLSSIIEKSLFFEKQRVNKKSFPSDEFLKEFVMRVVIKLIGMLSTDVILQKMPYIAKVSKLDEDIYFIEDWSLLVGHFFQKYQWDKVIKQFSDIKKCGTNENSIASDIFCIISAKAHALSQEELISTEENRFTIK